MAEARSVETNSFNASLRPAVSAEEIISPLEEIAYVKSHRMRRVRWSEDLEEIRYFNVKSKKDKRRASEDSVSGKNESAQQRRRFSELSISPVEKFRNWLDDKDFKSDVILLGLKMKSAFKKADFYDAEKKWEDVFEEDMKKAAVNGIEYKR